MLYYKNKNENKSAETMIEMSCNNVYKYTGVLKQTNTASFVKKIKNAHTPTTKTTITFLGDF